jgi:hypothetical protein
MTATPDEPVFGEDQIDPAYDPRRWAELEGSTEGPAGRGRDQEVISQTERPGSQATAGDHAISVAEVESWTRELIAARTEIELDKDSETSLGGSVLTLRCPGSTRSLVVAFDRRAGAVDTYRDGILFERVEVLDRASTVASRHSIEASFAWLCEV